LNISVSAHPEWKPNNIDQDADRGPQESEKEVAYWLFLPVKSSFQAIHRPYRKHPGKADRASSAAHISPIRLI
jgi:hypothetical protein